MTSTRPIRIPLVLACGGAFLALLDVTIANLAVPALSREFGGVGVSSLSWLVTLYAIVFAALLAPMGRFADLVGRRRLYAGGVIVFTVASLVAAAAPTFAILLAARAAQAIGGAAVVPAALAILLTDTPADRRTSAIGFWSASSAMAAVVGPALGGVLVDGLGWRTLFLINVPIGAALVWLALRDRPAETTERGATPDIAGTLLLTAGIGAVILGATQAPDWGWTGARTLACFATAAVALTVTIRRSLRHPMPAIEVRLWRSRVYRMANVVSALYGAFLYATLLFGVLFLVQVWHYSVLDAGLGVVPGAASSAAVGVALGRTKRKPSPAVLATVGSVALCIPTAVLALRLGSHPDFVGVWLPYLTIVGAGTGAVNVGASSAAVSAVAPESYASANGLNVAARQVGGALAVAALSTILATASTGSTTAFAELYAAVAGIAAITLVCAPSLSPKAQLRPRKGSFARGRSIRTMWRAEA